METHLVLIAVKSLYHIVAKDEAILCEILEAALSALLTNQDFDLRHAKDY